MLERKKPLGHRGHLPHTVSGARICSEPHVCVTIISLLLGFEVAQPLTFFFFFPLPTHDTHREGAVQIWLQQARVIEPATP